MKLQNKIYLFNLYTYYWLMKLSLHTRYLIEIKIDRRYDCHGVTSQISEKEYHISFNPRKHHSECAIIHTVLHEIGHLLHSWRGNDVHHEEYAERFALETMKQDYPYFYRRAVSKTKADVKKKREYPDHMKAYKRVLKALGEWND